MRSYLLSIPERGITWEVFGVWSVNSTSGYLESWPQESAPERGKFFGPSWLRMTQAETQGMSYLRAEVFIPENTTVYFELEG